MGSYFGKDTATKQNEMRRAQKKRQSMGKRGAKNETKLEDVKIRRHVQGSWADDTVTAIRNQVLAYPGRPITTQFFRKMMKNEGVRVVINDEGHDLEGREVTITNDGITSELGLELFSVTVSLDSTFGVRFNKDKHTGRVYVS